MDYNTNELKFDTSIEQIDHLKTANIKFVLIPINNPFVEHFKHIPRYMRPYDTVLLRARKGRKLITARYRFNAFCNFNRIKPYDPLFPFESLRPITYYFIRLGKQIQ